MMVPTPEPLQNVIAILPLARNFFEFLKEWKNFFKSSPHQFLADELYVWSALAFGVSLADRQSDMMGMREKVKNTFEQLKSLAFSS
jgi:uncharacterized protein YigA (DUF484 family)